MNMLCWRVRLAALFTIALVFCPLAHALDPDRSLAEAHRDHWGLKQGFPGGTVNAIAQTKDGYLWIGTQNGLVRFDGQRFSLSGQDGFLPFPEVPILDLRSDRSGGLWIRLHSPGLFRYYEGKFESVLPSTSDFDGVTALGTGIAGDVLLARFGDLLRFSGGTLSHLLKGNVPNQLAISIEETSDATLWIGTRDAGLLGYRNGQVIKVSGLPDLKVNCLLRGIGGTLWIGTDSGLTQWNGSRLQRPPMPAWLSHIQILSLAGDRDGNVWIGTARGLARISSHGDTPKEPPKGARKAPVNAVFEDREGNLWVGTSEGLDRYRDSAFKSYTLAAGHESENDGPLCADPKGRLWFGPSTGGLSWLEDDTIHAVARAELFHDVVYSIASGPEDLWIARQKARLTRLLERGGDFRTENISARNGLAEGPVYVAFRARNGSIWAGTGNGGVTRLENGRLTTFTTRDGLESNVITAIEETNDGTVWVATLDGLMSFSDGKWHSHLGESGLPPARINCLFVDANGVLWIGTEAGLAFSKDGRTFTSARLSGKLQGNILGVADDRRGYLWLAGDHFVLRASSAYLMGQRSEEEPLREFDTSDGLPAADGVRRDHSVIRDRIGHIWFSLQGGLAVVNPARIPSRSPPAIVHVEQMFVDGRDVIIRTPLHVQPGQQRIEFSYIGLSFSASEKVRYRYRLDGFDHEWNSPTSSRRAVYTNLSPGQYSFRVVASNSEGIWNSAEAKLIFTIEPHLWRTYWFQCSVLLLAIGALASLYQFRLHEITSKLNARFDERLAERTRIARELHDTLLQSLHGVMFRFQAVRNLLPGRPEEAMTALDAAIQRTEQAIDESRATIMDLRDSSAQGDFAELVTNFGEELGSLQNADRNQPDYGVTVEGATRPLSPMIQREVLLIAREVLSNAFRHASAKHIEAEIRFDRHALRLRFRDDGRGIDPEVLKAGNRPGHSGLPGIRERARRMGATLDFWSETGAGTEVQLKIPASVAYERSRDNRFWRLGRRGKDDEQRS